MSSTFTFLSNYYVANLVFSTTSRYYDSSRCFLPIGALSTADTFHIFLFTGDNLELKAGLVARDGLFKRHSDAVNLTMDVTTGVVNDVQPESIEIAPRSSWPTTLTAAAASPIILGIQLLNLPGNRAPESITWTVNEIEQGI